ncbi:mCG144833, partial [Mus musculus]
DQEPKQTLPLTDSLGYFVTVKQSSLTEHNLIWKQHYFSNRALYWVSPVPVQGERRVHAEALKSVSEFLTMLRAHMSGLPRLCCHSLNIRSGSFFSLPTTLHNPAVS